MSMFHKLDPNAVEEFYLDKDKLLMSSYSKELYVHVSIIVKR